MLPIPTLNPTWPMYSLPHFPPLLIVRAPTPEQSEFLSTLFFKNRYGLMGCKCMYGLRPTICTDIDDTNSTFVEKSEESPKHCKDVLLKYTREIAQIVSIRSCRV